MSINSGAGASLVRRLILVPALGAFVVAAFAGRSVVLLIIAIIMLADRTDVDVLRFLTGASGDGKSTISPPS